MSIRLKINLFLIMSYILPGISLAQSTNHSINRSQPDLVQIRRCLPEFLEQLQTASESGLNKEDYDFTFISKIIANDSVAKTADSTTIKGRVLAAMNHFFNDLLNGRQPQLSYNGLPDKKNHLDIPTIVKESLENDHFSIFTSAYEITHPLYQALKSTNSAINDSLALKPSFFARRLKSVQHALHTFRWISAILKQYENTIVVNIPSATLLLFRNENAIFESKVIVGKRSTRTPRMASVLTDITIYPYWIVPKSIATKELLPEIRKDISFLEKNNFQVLDKNGRILPAASVPWNTLSTTYFPYTIRQSTGCDNSLGLIKLNINNPFNVYLHDTPWKALFESPNRFFSHGCVRVQKAKELSHILLKENSIAVDTLDEKASLLGRKPTVLNLAGKIPVLILYNTTWFDAGGIVRFYPDIYSMFL